MDWSSFYLSLFLFASRQTGNFCETYVPSLPQCPGTHTCALKRRHQSIFRLLSRLFSAYASETVPARFFLPHFESAIGWRVEVSIFKQRERKSNQYQPNESLQRQINEKPTHKKDATCIVSETETKHTVRRLFRSISIVFPLPRNPIHTTLTTTTTALLLWRACVRCAYVHTRTSTARTECHLAIVSNYVLKEWQSEKKSKTDFHPNKKG